MLSLTGRARAIGMDRRRVKDAGAKAGSLRFNPLWLLDAAGIAGAVSFVFLAVAPPALPPFLDALLLREGALAVAVLAAAVRLVDLRNRRARARAAARSELLRRLTALDDALMDLRRSLSHETSRRFVERRVGFAAGLDRIRRSLGETEAGLAEAAVEICKTLAEELTRAIPRRAAIASVAYRLRQEADRAVRRGEISPMVARELSSLIEDGLAVMDAALFAESNADHFGRLGAVQRSFARQLEPWDGEIVRQIDRQAADLFAELNRHVRDKVDVADTLTAWEGVREPLEFALAGADAVRPRRMPPVQPRPRLSRRFDTAPAPGDRGDAPALPLRLPAAND